MKNDVENIFETNKVDWAWLISNFFIKQSIIIFVAYIVVFFFARYSFVSVEFFLDVGICWLILGALVNKMYPYYEFSFGGKKKSFSSQIRYIFFTIIVGVIISILLEFITPHIQSLTQ